MLDPTKKRYPTPKGKGKTPTRQNGSLKRYYKIAEKRRETKGKGEKKIYTHLNADLQRIARRDKKAFLSDQCKDIEKNNRI